MPCLSYDSWPGQRGSAVEFQRVWNFCHEFGTDYLHGSELARWDFEVCGVRVGDVEYREALFSRPAPLDILDHRAARDHRQLRLPRQFTGGASRNDRARLDPVMDSLSVDMPRQESRASRADRESRQAT